MKDVYPEFADQVAFYAIGQDITENIEQLEAYREKEGYQWPIATIERDVLRDLRIIIQSTKIALDHRGVITYRAGFANGSPSEWREVFTGLADGAK